MIRIVNPVKNKEIQIELSGVRFMPYPYNEDNPHVVIEFQNFSWFDHAQSCDECRTLLDDIGTDSRNWFLLWEDKIWPLLLKGVGKEPMKNRAYDQYADFFTGTYLKLNIDPSSVDELAVELQERIQTEDYERCALLRDRIAALKELSNNGQAGIEKS